MERELIEKYKEEMLNMYRSVKPQNAVYQEPAKAVPVQTEIKPPMTDQNGGLLAVVTTVDRLYPVSNAKVTIFTGELDNMNVLDTDFTNDSGKSKVFVLPTPAKQLSLESENTQIPYASYNMLVSNEGYLDNIHLNIPVFSGITSVQGSNLMLRETAGTDMNANIYDEAQKYNL